MNVLIILVIYIGILALTAALLGFMIFKSVGFRNLFAFFKTKIRRRKGWGLILLRSQTNYPRYIPHKFIGEPTLEIEGGQYNYKKKCMYMNEFDIPTIEFREGDADPIDPNGGLVTVTSAKAQECIIAGAVKARAAGEDKKFADMLKKYGTLALIVGGVILGAILFMYLRQGDALDLCMLNQGKTVIINASSLGK